MGMRLSFFLLFVSVALCDSSILFNLRPDVPEKVTAILYDMSCTFDYVASGGSSEEWVLEFEETDSGELICTVARPYPPSYLYFTSFQIEIEGGDIDGVEMHRSSGPLELGKDYLITENKRVHNLFQGELNLIEVMITEN